MSIHEVAARAYQAASDAYERGRPSYPPAAVAELVAELGVGPAATVVDLAAGTGKLTRLLVPTGARVVAVEPVAAMRAALVELAPGAVVVAGAAEALPLAGGSVDAVTVAQAFHWFGAEEALAEMARVLVAGGGLALVWNERDESVPWVAALNELMRWHDQDIPGYGGDTDWAAVVAGSGAFSPVQHREVANDHEVDVEILVARVLSTSYIATWPGEDQDALAGEVRQLVAGFPDRFPLPHRTELYWCHRA